MAEMTDKFIEDTVATANGWAIWFSGVPDAEVTRHLEEARALMHQEFEESYGADIASLLVDAFVKAVWSRRREIEADGAPPPSLN
jgi:hypothetical protein